MMRIFKRFTAAILVMIMFGFTLWTPTLEAAGNDSVVSGQCWICNTEWTLDTIAGKLVVSGNGEICLSCHYQWEMYQDKVKKIEIKSGVTSIGSYAFQGCSNLMSVDIPEGVTSIELDAFKGCSSLTSITIPKGVREIGIGAFAGCNSLREIVIPESVVHIGESAFENTAYYNTDSNWEDKVLYIDSCLIQAKTSIVGNYSIISGTSAIAEAAFEGCSSLTGVTIPKGVTEIGSSTFAGCNSLREIVIPESVVHIGVSAFENTAYYNTDSNWEDKVLYIDRCLIRAKTSIVGNYRIISGTRVIGEAAFEECSGLTGVTIPKGVTEIGLGTFTGCSSLTSIKIPKGVTSIGLFAFSGCSSLTSITIPVGVSDIMGYEFYYCSGLKSVTIPESVTKIEASAFEKCPHLTTVYYSGGKKGWNKITIIEIGNESLKSAAIHFDFKKTFTIKLSKILYTYSGKAQRPTVTVKDGAGNVLKKNTDYTVKYSGSGKSVGKYTVTITFKGNYNGKKTVSYTINPKNTSLKSVTTGSKAFTVKWNKQTKEVTGYQIRYSLKKNMSGSKTTTIKNTKTTSCKIKKLKANKKYYVQIRTYKTAGGKAYYSSWSKAKTVTTKK